MRYTYDYPRPCVSCEAVVFNLDAKLECPLVLLVLRKNEPFKGMWCLPGGFLELDEELEDCAIRECYEETGVDLAGNSSLSQVFTKGAVARDPRDRIISVVYTAVIDGEQQLCANTDADEVAWFRMDELPSLAADHLDTIRKTLGKVYHDYV